MDFDRFTQISKNSIQRANEIAVGYRQKEFGNLHVLAGLLSQEDTNVHALLERLEISPSVVLETTLHAIGRLPRPNSEPTSGPTMIIPNAEYGTLIETAFQEARKNDERLITTDHLFIALVKFPGSAEQVMNTFNIDADTVISLIQSLKETPQSSDESITERDGADTTTKNLSKYTRDFTKLAAEGKLDPVIGRDEELGRTVEILSRRSKNNPILIGEAGVGKTAIVEGLAQRIHSGDIPESMKNKRILSLDLALLLSGTKYRGEFEERLKKIVKEVELSKDTVILFIDEIHCIAGMGSAEGSVMDASNLLKPALARGEVRVIGATTLREYRQHIEKDHALTRRFQPVHVQEPSLEDAIAILRGLRDRYETFHAIHITDEAVVAAVNLSARYISDRHLPDKAIDLIDEAASQLRVTLENKPQSLVLAERELKRLEIERRALEGDLAKEDKDTNRKIKARVRTIDRTMGDIREKNSKLEKRWQNERAIIDEIKKLQKKLDDAKIIAEQAEVSADLDTAARITHVEIPSLTKNIILNKKKLESLHKKHAILHEQVTEEDIARVVSRWTGVPVIKMLENEQKKLLRMSRILERRVIGQDEVVQRVSDAVIRSRVGIADPDRPIGAFLFLGPTGVGKTEFAKQLAEFLFEDKKALLRIDMSEYMEGHSVSKLIGAPPGYIGHDDPGQLTEAVRHRPYSVVLLDEIEKAHPDIYNLLLQVFDRGALTDSKGRTVNFKNTIILMTSNIGSQYIKSVGTIGFNVATDTDDKGVSYTVMKEKVMEDVKKHFKPEFINRLDDILVFRPLPEKVIKAIVKKNIAELTNRLVEKNIVIKISPNVEKELAIRGYNHEYGARPLKRVIQEHILTPIASAMVSSGITEAAEIIVNHSKTDGFSVNVISKKKGRRKVRT